MSSLETVQDLIKQRNFEEAETALATLPADAQSQADGAYCRGLICEGTHRWNDAIEAYESAIQADDSHRPATFHLAYLLDRYGEDEKALELYEKCISEPPLHVNALINLSVLYEDAEQLADAEACLDLVLSDYPNHTRATLFEKDVDSSMTMYYDEDIERVREKRNAILDTPIGDFELSVRSRNCLKQMNINTLGDLLRITEPQLMAYKNFGETSLNEIKALLTQKGLHLGQLLEEQENLNLGPQPVPSLGDSGLYGRSVAELELSVRARKCLQRLGIISLGELCARSEAELLAIKNFGQTSLNEIKGRLMEMGLALRE
ncbi:MAG: DNA-directed RNA polymerase subunit alpha C-terminal domain-containing protein [Phycisphaerae bacterium]